MVTEKNLLEGPIFGKILRYIIPLIITNLIQNLYNAADMLIVGLSGVEGAIGAIGTTTALIHLVLNLFNGLSLGCGIIVSRHIGENDKLKIEQAVHTSIITAVGSGILGLFVGFYLCTPILAKMGDTGHILELASLYTKVYFLGVPFLSLTNFLIAIFRAKGDTETPLKVLMSTGLLNLVLNYIFVKFFSMSVDGVALATTLSNFASMILLFAILSKDTGVCKFSFKKLHFDISSFKDIVTNGVPAGIQASMFSLSNVIVQSSIINVNNIMYPGGSAVIDGNSAAASLEGIASATTGSIVQASMTFSSQHYGARAYQRLKRVITNCLFVGVILSSICSLILITFQVPLLKLYISSPEALKAGETRIVYMLSLYFIYGLMEAGQGILRGLSMSFATTIISILGIGVSRILWIKLFVESHPSLPNIFVSYPASWFITGVVYIFLIRKRIKTIQNKA